MAARPPPHPSARNFRRQRRPAGDGGQDLRAARLRRGDDLATVSRALKIRKDHLEAVEEDRLGGLPGKTYAIGFVRSYAGYLGLDASRRSSASRRKSPAATTSMSLTRRRSCRMSIAACRRAGASWRACGACRWLWRLSSVVAQVPRSQSCRRRRRSTAAQGRGRSAKPDASAVAPAATAPRQAQPRTARRARPSAATPAPAAADNPPRRQCQPAASELAAAPQPSPRRRPALRPQQPAAAPAAGSATSLWRAEQSQFAGGSARHGATPISLVRATNGTVYHQPQPEGGRYRIRCPIWSA